MTSDRARPSLQSQPWRRRVRAVIRARRWVTAVLVGVVAAGLPSPVVASSGGGRQITDAENTRTVYLVVTMLVLLAVGLAVFTWWFWRSTRREHESLAPLEVMADRKFLAGDAVARQVLLDGNRPVGAAPLAPGAPEPLMVAVGDDAGVEAAPAPLVVAAVGAGAPPSTDGDVDATTAVPAESSVAVGDATTLVPAQAEGDADDVATEIEAVAIDAPLATVTDAEPPGEEQATGEEQAAAEELAVGEEPAVADAAADADVDESPVAGADTVPAVDGDATIAVDLVAAASTAGASTWAAVEAAAPGASADTAPATDPAPAAGANGSGSAPAPIDPGLPVPPAEDEPVRHLSLAELVALQPEVPVGFADDELASTPSTGIPVVESAEAWVERQLAATKAARSEAGGTDAAAGDDPDETAPAAVHGAD